MYIYMHPHDTMIKKANTKNIDIGSIEFSRCSETISARA